MRTLFRMTLVAVAVLALVLPAAAQEADKVPKPAKPLILYRVDFAVRESEDSKPVNTRNYSMLVEVDERDRGEGQVRAGARIPVMRGTDVMYMEVGLNIDCELSERDGYVRMRLVWEVNNFAQEQESKERPVLRTIRSNVNTAVVPGKPTVVSSVDDTASKRRYELEVTATKVK